MNSSHSAIKIRKQKFIRPLDFFLASLLILILSDIKLQAQFLVGAGIGAENMHLTAYQPRQYAPHLAVEYITADMRATAFFAVTGFRKKQEYADLFTDTQGQDIHYQANDTYDRIIMHLGFKRCITGDIDEKKLILITGAGFANCISLTKTKMLGTDPLYPFEETIKTTENSFGLTFLGGVQYYLKPVIIELKGNLDLLLKKVTIYGEETNVHTSTRLTISIPLKSL